MKTDLSIEALKSTPAVAAVALTLNEWVMIITCVYVVLQAAYLARKWWREEKEWSAKK